MAQSISLEVREQVSDVSYAKDSLVHVAIGLGMLLIVLSIFFDQPGVAAMLVIGSLLLLVRHPA